MRRRTLLQSLIAALTSAPVRSAQRAAPLGDADRVILLAVAEAVLPSELGRDGRVRVVDGFVRWIRGYRADAEMDHGYGFTRLRRAPASPAAAYPAQLAALDRAARARGASIAALPLAARRAIVEAALTDARIERLPARPSGGHIAADLLAFYFNGSDANDLCYRAAIQREACRGLPGSEHAPEPLSGRRSRG